MTITFESGMAYGENVLTNTGYSLYRVAVYYD